MPNMHPPTLTRDTVLGRTDGRGPSDGEILVYRAFRDHLDDSWDVYYSIWLRDSAGPMHAEADFVIVGPEGILVFEVKGGFVERLPSGKWQFTTKTGKRSEEKERSPVDQVRDAWHALRRHVKQYCGDTFTKNRLWGYGVITPECMVRFEGPDPGLPAQLWLDQAGFQDNFLKYVRRTLDYWLLDLDKRGLRGRVYPLTAADRAQLARAMQPVIRCVPGAGTDARSVDSEVIRLTADQCRALDYARLDSRLIIRGGAGTGKTLIAAKKAAREAAGGKRVLFVCFNRLLADHLARDSQLATVDVATYHQLVYRLATRAGLDSAIPENWTAFNHVADDIVLDALGRLGDSFEPWDYLVVDEAQDLMTESFMPVLGLLIPGGLEGGRWLMSLDIEQAIFSSQFNASYFDRMVTTTNARQVPLPDNCRNTLQIAAYSHGLGRVSAQSRGVITGRIPTFEYYSDDSDLRRKFRRVVNRLAGEFREAKLDASRITILLGTKDRYEALVQQELNETVAQGSLLRSGVAPQKGRIQVSTIQAFKGLESDAVIVVGLDDLSQDWQCKLFYVASTRARAVLEVLLPDDQLQVVSDATGAVLVAIAATTTDDVDA